MLEKKRQMPNRKASVLEASVEEEASEAASAVALAAAIAVNSRVCFCEVSLTY